MESVETALLPVLGIPVCSSAGVKVLVFFGCIIFFLGLI